MYFISHELTRAFPSSSHINLTVACFSPPKSGVASLLPRVGVLFDWRVLLSSTTMRRRLLYLTVSTLHTVVETDAWLSVNARNDSWRVGNAESSGSSLLSQRRGSAIPIAQSSATLSRRLAINPRSTLQLSYSNKNNGNNESSGNPNYSDDFFGLLFLGSSLGLRDTVFSVVFLAVSLVAATVSRSDNWKNDLSSYATTVELPGIVAVASFGLASLVKLLLMVVSGGGLGMVDLPVGPLTVDTTTATCVEAVACLASFAYTTSSLAKK